MAHEARVLCVLALSMGGMGMGMALPLAAQDGPPPIPTLNPGFQAPSPGEFLPLRPTTSQDAREGAVPIRYWGKDVIESMDGWSMDDGAVESPDLLLLADHLRFSTTTGELEAEGHIRMEGPGLRLRCARLRMDWKKKVGEAWALDMELPPSWYLTSEKVAFTTMKHWDFEGVELSPCPQEDPGWKAQLSRLTVDLDHYATIRNLWIWVGGVPTFYFIPWAKYPAKAERTSGLLPTTLSFSGPMGASVQIPYYQVLGDSADVTLSPEIFTREGVLWQGEARWNPEPTHRGSFSGEYIRQRSDGAERFEFNFKELWQREDGWQFAADINRASDALLDADYGQGLARLGGTPFDSSFFLGKSFPWASFSVTASEQRSFFFQDSTAPANSSFANSLNPAYANALTRQVLPSFQGTLFPIPMGQFYLDGGVRVGRMTYKPDIEPLTPENPPLAGTYAWERDDAFLRFQGRLGQWGPFRADLETLGRFTHYAHSLEQSYFDVNNTTAALDNNLDYTANTFRVDGGALDRTLGSARLMFSAPPIGKSFEDVRLFGYGGEIKHVVNPYFAFNATGGTSAEGRIPHFDEVDSQPGVAGTAAGERSLELGLKQHFLGRSGLGIPFLDLVRWNLSTKFHFEPILLSDGRVMKGWASLDSDMDVEPNSTLRITFRRSSDVTDSDSDQSLSADYRTPDGGHLNLAYYSTGINRLLVPQKGIAVGGMRRLWGDQFRLEFQANYDFRQKLFASSQVALAYLTPCVATSLRFSHIGIQVPGSLTKEDRLDLVMTLRGLGDLGKASF